jgi:hypothetical protein
MQVVHNIIILAAFRPYKRRLLQFIWQVVSALSFFASAYTNGAAPLKGKEKGRESKGCHATKHASP